MKKMKRLLSSLLALLLVFCSLSAGMTVLAAEETEVPEEGVVAVASTPFASFTVGGRKVDFSKATYSVVTNYTAATAKIQWKLNKGWKLSELYYGQYVNGKYKETKVKNGDTVKIAKGDSLSLNVMANTDDYSKSFYGGVEIIREKLALKGTTVWMGVNEQPVWTGSSFNMEPVEVKSSNTKVLAVKKQKDNTSIYGYNLVPKKPGKAVITAKIKVNGEEKTFKATYTVKKFPNALKSLKVGGKTINLKKNKTYAQVKTGKKTAKVEYKIAKGWKVKCVYYNGKKYVNLKSGGTVSTPKWVVFQLTKGKDMFWYDMDVLK